MGEHTQKSHDLHEFDNITAPVSDGDYILELNKASSTFTYTYEPRAGIDTTAIHDNVAAEINVIAEKASPVAADIFLIEDSADSNNKKKAQIGNLSITQSQISDLDAPSVSTGTAAPATTPAQVGDIFVDTTNDQIYMSSGTASSNDWDHIPLLVDVPELSSGSGVPSTTPTKGGDIYLDNTDDEAYVSFNNIHPTDWVAMARKDRAPEISTGSAAPSTTPGKVGDMFVDTTNKNVYVSIGTSGSVDWELMNGP